MVAVVGGGGWRSLGAMASLAVGVSEERLGTGFIGTHHRGSTLRSGSERFSTSQQNDGMYRLESDLKFRGDSS